MTSDEYRHTSFDLADEFGVNVRTIRKRAFALGLGIDLGGRTGRRFNDADRQRLIESWKPQQPVVRKRRRAA